MKNTFFKTVLLAAACSFTEQNLCATVPQNSLETKQVISDCILIGVAAAVTYKIAEEIGEQIKQPSCPDFNGTLFDTHALINQIKIKYSTALGVRAPETYPFIGYAFDIENDIKKVESHLRTLKDVQSQCPDTYLQHYSETISKLTKVLEALKKLHTVIIFHPLYHQELKNLSHKLDRLLPSYYHA